MEWDSFFIGLACGVVVSCVAVVAGFFWCAERIDHVQPSGGTLDTRNDRRAPWDA